MTVNPDKLKVALDALTDLVRDVLASDESSRFARAAALSTLASKVALHGTPLRTKDAKRLMRNRWGNPGYDAPELVDADGNGYLMEDENHIMNIGAAVYPGIGGGVAAAHHPNALEAAGPISQVLATVQGPLAAQGRSHQARELENLINARNLLRESTDAKDRLRATGLEERMDNLIAAIAASDKERSNADVVPTEPARGHSAAVVDQGEDEAHDLRPVVPGEGGDDGADPGGGEGSGPWRTMAPRDVPPFGSKLDQGAVGGAASEHQQGAEGVDQAPEAKPRAGERGEVRGRQDGRDDREGVAATGGNGAYSSGGIGGGGGGAREGGHGR